MKSSLTKPAPGPPTSGGAVAISPDDGSEIDLGNPFLAALLAWLLPGLGHLYQGRTVKGGLLMAGLLTALVAGLWMGDGRVVYASWRPGDMRLAFLGQAGIGALAIPALLQSSRLSGAAREPWFGSSWLAPPLRVGQPVTPRYSGRVERLESDLPPDAFIDRPPARICTFDQLSSWHRRLGRFFEFGTLYTALAGMLNVLAVYDAWAGPMRDGRQDDEQDSSAAGGARRSAP
jgi:hypothetical protein